VWHRRFLLSWPPLLAVTVVTTIRPLSADDPSASSDGYKTVFIKHGDKSLPIRVRESDPFKNITSPAPTGKYDPTQFSFNTTSSMANKSFSQPTGAPPTGNDDANNGTPNTFVTKSYRFDSNAPSAPDLDRKSSVSANSAFNRTAPGFDKSYSASTTDAAQNQTALFASTTSTDQGRTAVLSDHSTTSPGFVSPLSGKVFQGEEADALHRSLTRMKNGQMLVTDLPDRPLTIDEVRALINHGFKPDTSAPPPPPSKPLNDPNYQPEPLREEPPAANAGATDDDKDAAVPPPGTMSAPPPPENTQPLPQP